jgi:hypothetical protein
MKKEETKDLAKYDIWSNEIGVFTGNGAPPGSPEGSQ